MIKYVYLKTYEGEFPNTMLTLLLLLSFNFDSIPSPQFTGDSFFITINTVDSVNLTCSLSVIPNNSNLEICGEDQNIINMAEGLWKGWIKILNTTDSVTLKCKDLKNKDFSLSNRFEVIKKENLSQLRQSAVNDSINIYPNPFTTEHNSVFINYPLNVSAHVSVMIFDKFGNLVWNAETEENPIPWDGTDNNGNNVFSGTYIICINATNQTGSIAQYSGKIAVIR
jgi:hypothetical protein